MPKKPSDQDLFLAWCKRAKIAPKPRPLDNFDIGPPPKGQEYVLDPHVKIMAGKEQLKMRKGSWLTVRFDEAGQWAGGSMMIWGKNPWESKAMGRAR